jgi:hypothetical protein
LEDIDSLKISVIKSLINKLDEFQRNSIKPNCNRFQFLYFHRLVFNLTSATPTDLKFFHNTLEGSEGLRNMVMCALIAFFKKPSNRSYSISFSCFPNITNDSLSHCPFDSFIDFGWILNGRVTLLHAGYVFVGRYVVG